MNIEFASKLPGKLPAKARVYALASPRLGASTVRALAERLVPGAKAFEVSTSDRTVGAAIGRWAVEAHRASGAWSAVHRDRYGLDEGVEFAIDDRKAAALARRFAKSVELLPDGESELLAVTHLRTAGGDGKERAEKERLLDAGIVFGRRIDGLPVFGPGGQAMVNLAADGEVVGVHRLWRTLGRGVATVAVRPAGWALEQLTAHLRKTAIGDVTVLKSQFGYLEFGALDRQTLIEPVYAFVYAVQHDEVRSKHVHVLPAGGKAHGRLIGPKRFPAGRQTRRRNA